MDLMDTKIARLLVIEALENRVASTIEPDPNHVDLIADLIKQRDEIDQRIEAERKKLEEEEYRRNLSAPYPQTWRPA